MLKHDAVFGLGRHMGEIARDVSDNWQNP